MTTLIVVVVFVLLGLGVLWGAFRGGFGPTGRPARPETRSARRVSYLGFVLALAILGVGVPAAVIAAVIDRTSIPGANVSNLTDHEKTGRELFARRCAACHTLQAVHSSAQVGPNLDELRPNAALVLTTIKNGKSEGNGQMPAAIYDGQEAQDVADFVAKSVGTNTTKPAG